MLRSTSVVITTIGASPLITLSPVSSPTLCGAVHPDEVAVLLVRERLQRRRVEGLGRPMSSAAAIAYSATSVLPAPVGAATSTERPASSTSSARRWKSSSGNGCSATKRARSRSLPVTGSRSSRGSSADGRVGRGGGGGRGARASGDGRGRRAGLRRARAGRGRGRRRPGFVVVVVVVGAGSARRRGGAARPATGSRRSRWHDDDHAERDREHDLAARRGVRRLRTEDPPGREPGHAERDADQPARAGLAVHEPAGARGCRPGRAAAARPAGPCRARCRPDRRRPSRCRRGSAGAGPALALAACGAHRFINRPTRIAPS